MFLAPLVTLLVKKNFSRMDKFLSHCPVDLTIDSVSWLLWRYILTCGLRVPTLFGIDKFDVELELTPCLWGASVV